MGPYGAVVQLSLCILLLSWLLPFAMVKLSAVAWFIHFLPFECFSTSHSSADNVSYCASGMSQDVGSLLVSVGGAGRSCHIGSINSLVMISQDV